MIKGVRLDQVMIFYPCNFMLPKWSHQEISIALSLFSADISGLGDTVQERGVLHIGTWRTLRVPHQRLERQGHPWFNGWSYFIEGSWLDPLRKGYHWPHWGPCFTLWKIPWKGQVEIFIRGQVEIFIRSVSGMGGPSWGNLKEVKCSCPDTWRTGSSLMSWS